ncbi:MAG: hypothetical protein RML12_07380 [Xanthomonadales bacterium]|nr:hypothetical protein [Xanthomonadales bacterium]
MAVSHNHRMDRWFHTVVYAPDQLRQRMAFALSQILVISDRDPSLASDYAGVAEYWDLLAGACLRQLSRPDARGQPQPADGPLPHLPAQPQGRSRDRPAARRELCARTDAALHHRADRAQRRLLAGARCPGAADPDLRPGHDHGARAGLHRLHLRRLLELLRRVAELPADGLLPEPARRPPEGALRHPAARRGSACRTSRRRSTSSSTTPTPRPSSRGS